MSSDSSEDENLEHFKEATDLSFFKNSLYNGEVESVVEDTKIETIPSLRVKEEDNQFRLFNVTPQFQKYVGNALSQKIEKYLSENLAEYCEKKKKRKKIHDCIKLLSSSKYPIEIGCENDENSKNGPRIRPKARKPRYSISESDFKLLAISGEDILNKKGTEFWSNRSKAPIYNYTKNTEGVLCLKE